MKINVFVLLNRISIIQWVSWDKSFKAKWNVEQGQWF